MYHVGTNKRSHDSAELIYYGVAICSQNKPLEYVTISDVQRVTGIARTTFYRSFDNVLDVLEWKCDQYYQSFLASCPADVIEGLSLRQLTQSILSYMNDNPELPIFLIAQDRIPMLFERYHRLVDDLEMDPSRFSPYSLLLSWAVPILLLLCKSINQLPDSPEQIWDQLRRDEFFPLIY